MVLLNYFNFAMIHIICKTLVLPENHLNYLINNVFDVVLRNTINFYIFQKYLFYSI